MLQMRAGFAAQLLTSCFRKLRGGYETIGHTWCCTSAGSGATAQPVGAMLSNGDIHTISDVRVSTACPHQGQSPEEATPALKRLC